MSFKFLIYYKIMLLTILEETTKELYISVDNCIAEWEIINKQIQKYWISSGILQVHKKSE